MTKITGKIERIPGDFSGNAIPMIECPARGFEKASIQSCRQMCCSHASKVFIDYEKGICAVDCKYMPPTAEEVFKDKA